MEPYLWLGIGIVVIGVVPALVPRRLRQWSPIAGDPLRARTLRSCAIGALGALALYCATRQPSSLQGVLVALPLVTLAVLLIPKLWSAAFLVHAVAYGFVISGGVSVFVDGVSEMALVKIVGGSFVAECLRRSDRAVVVPGGRRVPMRDQPGE